jgi:hypothetical protein
LPSPLPCSTDSWHVTHKVWHVPPTAHRADRRALQRQRRHVLGSIVFALAINSEHQSERSHAPALPRCGGLGDNSGLAIFIVIEAVGQHRPERGGARRVVQVRLRVTRSTTAGPRCWKRGTRFRWGRGAHLPAAAAERITWDDHVLRKRARRAWPPRRRRRPPPPVLPSPPRAPGEARAVSMSAHAYGGGVRHRRRAHEPGRREPRGWALREGLAQAHRRQRSISVCVIVPYILHEALVT